MALTDNLKAYYKLDESSGNPVDSVGSNNLTNVNSSPFVAGKINNCVDLESGSLQYLYGPDSADFDITGDLTVSFWVNFESLSINQVPISKWNPVLNQQSYCIFINSTNVVRFLISSNGSTESEKNWSPSLSTGVWYHFVFIYKASTGEVSFYLNGSLVSTQSGLPNSIYNSSTRFLIGNHIDNSDGVTPSSGRYLDGKMDEVGIWSRALSSGEVSELYNSGNGLQYPFVPPVVAPSVDTLEATDITTNSGTLNGEITDTGGENADERGFVWDSESKSAPGNVAPVSSGYEDYFTDSGDFSEGVFDHGIEFLDTGTIYYFRAYAHNSEGYTYGEELTIETLPAEIFRFENIPGVEYNPNDKQTIFAERLNEILDRLHNLDGLDPYEE